MTASLEEGSLLDTPTAPQTFPFKTPTALSLLFKIGLPVRLHVLGGRNCSCWFITKSLAAPRGPAHSSLSRTIFHLFDQYLTLVFLQTRWV